MIRRPKFDGLGGFHTARRSSPPPAFWARKRTNERTKRQLFNKQQNNCFSLRLRNKSELSAKWPHDAQTRGVRNNMKSSLSLCSCSLFITRRLRLFWIGIVVLVSRMLRKSQAAGKKSRVEANREKHSRKRQRVKMEMKRTSKLFFSPLLHPISVCERVCVNQAPDKKKRRDTKSKASPSFFFAPFFSLSCEK